MTVDEDGKPAPGSKWRLRWREHGKQRSRWFYPDGPRARTPPEAAIEMQAAVLAALQRGELPSGALAPAEPEPEATAHTFDEAAASFIKHKNSNDYEPSTIQRITVALTRFQRAVRELRGIPDEHAIPMSIMSRDLFSEVSVKLRDERLTRASRRRVMAAAANVWEWGFDSSPPGSVPAPPRTREAIVPRAPKYRAPVPPTIEEMDAVIAAIGERATVARAAAIFQRFTGLRVGAVTRAARRDLDLHGCRFHVRHGKSEREKVEERWIPVSEELIRAIAPYLGDDPDGPMIRRRSDYKGAKRYDSAIRSIRAAWLSCTEAGTVRAETWQRGHGRAFDRPCHAFRSGFQAYLVAQGAPEAIVDYLCGHSGDLRSRSYVPPEQRFDLARPVVALLPPLGSSPEADEETEAAAAGGEVVQFRRG